MSSRVGINFPRSMKWRVWMILSKFASGPLSGTHRVRMLRWLGHKGLGECYVAPGVEFLSRNTEIGDGSYVNLGCLFDKHDVISIGRNVFIGPRCMFITGTHTIGPRERRAGTHATGPIVVADGAWLGAGVIVLPGVTVASGCVIAAGAVVVDSTLPDGLYGGVPAKLIRRFG